MERVRAVDFLASLPDVDPARIGVTGASGGGTQSLLLAAIDDRVAAAVPAVMVSANMQGGCICENASLLRVGTNNIELTALAAPRPVAAVAANDWTHDFMTKGLPELKTIYTLAGAPDAVAGQHFNFPHNDNQVSREYAYNWFNRVFTLGQPRPGRKSARSCRCRRRSCGVRRQRTPGRRPSETPPAYARGMATRPIAS